MIVMKKLLSILSASLMACAVASCSSTSEPVGDEPQFQQNSASSTSSESASSSSTEAASSSSAKPGKDKTGGLKERDPKDFMAGGDRANIPNPIPAVKSPDGRVLCLIHEEADAPNCKVEFADPPIYPGPVMQSWRSNAVSYQSDRGFYPVWAIEFYRPTEVETLNEGETVSFDGGTFEAHSGNEFTVKANGHHFTVKDDGQYYSDTFPAKPNAEGIANTGAVCGESGTRGEDTGLVYVQEDGTNCNDAMELLDEYANHDWQPAEGGSRGHLETDLGHCSYGAPKLWEDTPENRLLGCSLDSGGSVVVITSRNMETIP